MAWAPSTKFEEDMLDMQPGFNFILGQLEYESKLKKSYIPRPMSTYEYLAKREKRNMEIDQQQPDKSEEIRASLAMMERIQAIAGTKPLGEHASMADWDDTSTVEYEAVAMMRNFGMMSMADGALLPLRPEFKPPPGKMVVLHNGRRSFPFILDPEYFEPGRTRKPVATVTSNSLENNTISSISVDTTSGSVNTESSEDQDFVEIPYELLEDSTEGTTKSQANQKSEKSMNRSTP